MNKFVSYLFCIVILSFGAVLFTACNNDDPTQKEKQFTVVTKSLKFSSLEETKIIEVTAKHVVWKAESPDAWLSVEYSVTEGKVNVRASVNEQEEERVGSVVISCKGFESVSVPVTQSGGIPAGGYYLVVDPSDPIEIGPYGAEITLAVDSNTAWEAEASDSWMTYAKESDNSIVLTIERHSGSEPRSGSITFNGANVESVVIEISQEGFPEPTNIIWDRSMASRMNYKGQVSFSSLHLSPAFDDAAIRNVSFNSDGMVTSYQCDVSNTVQVTYDSFGRIEHLTLKSSNNDIDISFAYGDHGIYIPTEQFFYDFSMTAEYSNMAWFPLFIENLEYVTMVDNKVPDNNTKLHFYIDREESTGTTEAIIGYEGGISGGTDPTYQELVITNGYVTSVDYFDASYFRRLTDVYTIDESSGKILTQELQRGFDIVRTRVYNDDNINSVSSESRINKTTDIEEEFRYGYNENLDIVSIESNYGYTCTYEYDANKNWTKLIYDVGEPDSREITYF